MCNPESRVERVRDQYQLRNVRMQIYTCSDLKELRRYSDPSLRFGIAKEVG
jgi:hypothetical protein